MSNIELLEYQGALSKNKFSYSDPSEIIRISSGDKIGPDTILEYLEGVVDPFRIDIIKTSECKAGRSQMSKTQVFFQPGNPYIRNRSSHTTEVKNIATISSEVLGLNTNLCESIALGHDLGHGPAGHSFEYVAKETGTEFLHEAFSAIDAIFIERGGSGLNLTQQTIEGILKHSYSTGKLFVTKNSIDEYNLVMHGDKIGYIFSDINDFIRFGDLLSKEDLALINHLFPGDQKQRVKACIKALVKESAQEGKVSFEKSETAQKFKIIRDLMIKNYTKLDEGFLRKGIKSVLSSINEIPELKNYDPILVGALMTDNELNSILNKIISCKRINLTDFSSFGVNEIIQNGFLENQTYQGLEMKLRQKLTV